MAYITKDGKWLAYRDALMNMMIHQRDPLFIEINECNTLANPHNQHFEVNRKMIGFFYSSSLVLEACPAALSNSHNYHLALH